MGKAPLRLKLLAGERGRMRGSTTMYLRRSAERRGFGRMPTGGRCRRSVGVGRGSVSGGGFGVRRARGGGHSRLERNELSPRTRGAPPLTPRRQRPPAPPYLAICLSVKNIQPFALPPSTSAWLAVLVAPAPRSPLKCRRGRVLASHVACESQTGEQTPELPRSLCQG